MQLDIDIYTEHYYRIYPEKDKTWHSQGIFPSCQSKGIHLPGFSKCKDYCCEDKNIVE